MINYKGLQILEILEGANNYNKWIAETILKYINHEDLVDAKFKKMVRFNR